MNKEEFVRHIQDNASKYFQPFTDTIRPHHLISLKHSEELIYFAQKKSISVDDLDNTKLLRDSYITGRHHFIYPKNYVYGVIFFKVDGDIYGVVHGSNQRLFVLVVSSFEPSKLHANRVNYSTNGLFVYVFGYSSLEDNRKCEMYCVRNEEDILKSILYTTGGRIPNQRIIANY